MFSRRAERVVGAVLILAGAAFLVPLSFVGIVLGLALLVIGFAFLRGAPRLFRRERVVPPVVPPVAEADLDGLKEPITACPECGFLGVRSPTIGEGLWPGGGETDARRTCPRCDYLGLPIEFETREDYATFLRALATDARA